MTKVEDQPIGIAASDQSRAKGRRDRIANLKKYLLEQTKRGDHRPPGRPHNGRNRP